MLVHTLFDLMAWILAALLGLTLSRTGWLVGASARPRFAEAPGYFLCLALGAILGAVVFGSLNMTLAGLIAFGHSIAGAIAGGVVAVEIYKKATGLTGSTGLPLVAPLALGIAVGRFGCFFAGLPDYTYGTPTALAWGVDFGDGVFRHPVQLYEAAAMAAFLAWFLVEIRRRKPFVLRNGFYLFVLWYGLQRFVWEFLKPYPAVLGPFNTFHLVCVILILYAIAMMRRPHDLRPAI